MADKPRVIVVGGMAFNLPREFSEALEVVKHIEQSASHQVGTLPRADYILVISDFASHTLVENVRSQIKVPVIYLPKGWSGMRQELQKRSILPPDSGPTTRGSEAASQETPTTTGLSEDELWKLYRSKLIEAAKGALKPRELVSEHDLLEILGDLVGLPPGDVQLLLPRLHMGGVVVPVNDGSWSLMIDSDAYIFDTTPASDRKPTRRKEVPLPGGLSPREKGFDRARKITGLLIGPYPTIKALCLEMVKYKEFCHEDGTPLSVEACRRLIQKAVELKLVDDSHERIYVDHKSEIVLTRVQREMPEPVPATQPKLTEEGRNEAVIDEARQAITAQKLGKMTREEAESHWAYVVNEVKRQKRHVGTILENGRIEWLPDTSILIFLVPQEFSAYLSQLESTENWGLISTHARMRFGQAVVIRFILDNGLKKVRA